MCFKTLVSVCKYSIEVYCFTEQLFWLRDTLTKQMNCEECHQAGAAGTTVLQ